jgi:hypothetical protein
LGGRLRSYRGRGGGWFRRAVQRHEGRIRAGGVERDVTFVEPADADPEAINQAYRSKYANYSRTYVDPMVAPDAVAATLRLTARSATGSATSVTQQPETTREMADNAEHKEPSGAEKTFG